MNRHLHSPTQLTEFAREFEEPPDTLFGKIVNRLTNVYNNSYNSVNEAQQPAGRTLAVGQAGAGAVEVPETPDDSPTDLLPNLAPLASSPAAEMARSSLSSSVVSVSNDEASSSSGDKSEEMSARPSHADDRTKYGVLRRLSSLMAKNNGMVSYKDTEWQTFWMPDAKSKECYECAAKFTAFRRKHHCRLCGQIFCSKCCNQVVPGKIIKCSGDLKVCTYCAQIVLSYLKSPDINDELTNDLQALKDDLSVKLSTTTDHQQQQLDTQSLATQIQRKVSLGYQEERLVSNAKSNLSNADRKQMLQQSNSLKTLHSEMTRVLATQIRGSELIAYMKNNRHSSSAVQAIPILSAMIEAGFLIPLSQPNEESVDDEMLLDFNELGSYRLMRLDDAMSHSGTFQLDLDVDASSVHLSRPSVHDGSSVSDDSLLSTTQDTSVGFSTSNELEMHNSVMSTAGSKQLMEVFCDHEELLLSQILATESLSDSWSKVLLPMCAEIANSFQPSLCGMMGSETRNLMDIRNFVNFKKVPGGQRAESKIVGGVGFTKNVVHKEMASMVDKPRVLLLKCAIVFQRVEGKFVSLDNVLRQENEHLRNVTARIMSLKPNVVLVHKNVAGIAQDMLRKSGITLVLDVKLSVLERLSRSLSCDIVDSIDSKIGRPKLGTCNRFYTTNFDDNRGCPKTLMFFEIQSFQRGCCVLLRGGPESELVKVKKVARLLLYARYNWRLELSLLLDEFARPPSPKPSIFDSKDQSPVKNEEPLSILIEHEPIESDLPPIENSPRIDAKKANDEKTFTKENVQDFTDPLRATDLSPSTFDPESSVEFAVEMPVDNRFKTALNSTVLSVSPYSAFPLPYLETEHGRKCCLRSFYPPELFYSRQWSNVPEKQPTIESLANHSVGISNVEVVKFNPDHEFLTHRITTSADNREVQTLLASFRASGGRLPKTASMRKIVRTSSSGDSMMQKINDDDDLATLDALDIHNHQRLAVLFCNFCSKDKSTSSFCVQPSLLDMIFYGANDIMLGKFLEYYCFRRSYMCSFCNLPMLFHVRRYVHSMGCVQVELSEDHSAQNSDQVFMTSRCSVCQEWTPSIPMSKDTEYLSFGKYLEHRFHSHAYKRRHVDVDKDRSRSHRAPSVGETDRQMCTHSMHRDHIQFFLYKGIVASFTYIPIEFWEIGLPAPILTLYRSSFGELSVSAMEETKSFSQLGYEVFAKIYEKLALISSDSDFPMLASLKQTLNRDQLAFRDKVGVVQTLMTEPIIDLCDVQDAMHVAKKTLADSIESWTHKLSEAAAQSRLHATMKAEAVVVVDAGTICTEDLRSESPVENIIASNEPIDASSLQQSESADRLSSSNDSSPVKQVSETHLPPKDPSDKKTVKSLLRELLPSDKLPSYVIQSPLPANEHHSLPVGQFPLLVNDQDISSVIGYSLVSSSYLRALDAIQLEYYSESATAAGSTVGNHPSPSISKKLQDGWGDATGEDRDSGSAKEDKPTKCASSHIEVAFQDATTQFSCRVYFAREFDSLRCNLIRCESPPSKASGQKPSREPPPSDTSNVYRKSSGSSVHHIRMDEAKELAQKQSTMDEVRHMFARSLGTSIQWEARGGKSGSKFCKTMDDRFVLKEMSKVDVAIFESFAPKYFEYINQCLKREEVTLLAKIFGVFKVTIKKKDSTQEKTLLIMENLFFNSKITSKYDLKGSERNRLVDTTNFSGEHVLLDENLIQKSWSEPLYILKHSKHILREALLRDASFLELNKVMDYSLLVGLNSSDRLLVLGIIDYIRTFTLDKRIESIVKKSPFLGGQGKLPTVISPRQYKQRFTEAMERYFLSVPDRWEGFSKIT